MNFKPTILKSIISFLGGVVVNYLLAGNGPFSLFRTYVDCLCVKAPCYCPQATWIDQAFNPFFLIYSLLAMVLVYCGWSAFQKDNKKKTK